MYLEKLIPVTRLTEGYRPSGNADKALVLRRPARCEKKKIVNRKKRDFRGLQEQEGLETVESNTQPVEGEELLQGE